MKIRSKTTRRVVRVVAAGALSLGVLAPAAAAHADDYITPPPSVDPGASVKSVTTTQPSSLPFTGGDVAAVAAAGAGATLIGFAMVRHSRRARANA